MASVFMMVGVPGSGKSTIANKLSEITGAKVLSSDEYRQRLLGDMNNQNNNGMIFDALFTDAKNYLISNTNIILDMCNVTEKDRRNSLTRLAGIYDKFIAVELTTSMSDCIYRNNQRERVVPETVIHSMKYRYVSPKCDEGFTKVIQVDTDISIDEIKEIIYG